MGAAPDYPKDRVMLPNGMYLLIYQHRSVLKLASKDHRLFVEDMHGQAMHGDSYRGSDLIIRADEESSAHRRPDREHAQDYVCIRREELDELRQFYKTHHK